MHEDQALLDAAGDSGAEIVERLRCIQSAAEEIVNVGLSRRALVVLLQDQTKLPKCAINGVLDGLTNLGGYLADPADDEEG